jgi:large subunit ribosomal protein L29
MALSKAADARKLSDEELAAEILNAKQKLFELRLQRATRRLETTHDFKHTRRWIAQLLTVEHERHLANATATSEATSTDATDGAEAETTTTEEE